MENLTKIKDLMTTELTTVNPYDSIKVVADIFERNNFHHIPVVDQNGELEGMVTTHDYNKILSCFTIFNNDRAKLENNKMEASLLVKDIMTKQVAKLNIDDTVANALGIFRENLFHAVPVVDGANKVVGILSTFDLLNFAFNGKNLIPVP